MKYLVSLLLTLGMTSYGWCQVDTIQRGVSLRVKHYGDSIVLRWAPTSADLWLKGIQQGYRIGRRVVDDRKLGYEEIVSKVMPWSKEEMEKYFLEHQGDEEIVVPLQTIHAIWDTVAAGASPSELYDASIRFQQRYQMDILASDIYPVVADASGLRFVDTDIDSTLRYAYRVEMLADRNMGDNSFAFRQRVIDRPLIFEAVELEGAVQLTWERKLNDRAFTSYHIERSVDAVNFERLTDAPYVHALSSDFQESRFHAYIDSIDNYQKYYYRLVGIDPFGDESLPSPLVEGQARDRTSPVVDQPNVEYVKEETATQISWKMDGTEIAGVVIYKDDARARNQVIWQGDQLEGTITDTVMAEGVTDYYAIGIDTAGNLGRSQKSTVFVADDVPPLAPENLSAEVDSNGFITLTWAQGPDRDVIGYFIYSADHRGKNFIKLNPQKHLARIYIDSVDAFQLTEHRYYKVAAIDDGGNIGPYSEVLEVDRPDRVPPAPPLFSSYEVDTSGVFLGLTPSASLDVTHYVLYRKEGQTGDWQEHLRIPVDKFQPAYWDQEVQSNEVYGYRFVAIDHMGQTSDHEPSTIVLRSYDRRVSYRPQLRVSDLDDQIELNVIDDIPGANFRIEVFRSIGDEPFRSYRYLTGNERSLRMVKSTAAINKGLRFRARILYKDGKRSRVGDTIAWAGE